MNKLQLINNIIAYLEKELKDAVLAATNARDAAVNDESVAETQYDTIAIEAGYLAHGQSKRVEEFETAIKAFHVLKVQKNICNEFDKNDAISIGTLVQLEQDKCKAHWFFIAPFAGGFTTSINNQKITVITPQSPIGQVLVGKYCDDEIKMRLGINELEDFISSVI